MRFTVPGSLPNLTYFHLMERDSPTEEQTRQLNYVVRRAAPKIGQVVPFLCENVYHLNIVEFSLYCQSCGDYISGKCFECLDNTCDDCGDPY